MSLDSKVIWTEGMFLNPHHFQQQERYFERYIDGKCSAYGAYGWGVHSIEIDRQLLKLGKISIARAKGVFPDGTPFQFPDVDEPPPVFEVPENTANKIVYLGVPVRRQGAVDVLSKDESQGLARYYSTKQAARDVSFEGSESMDIDIGKLRMRILLESDDLSGFAVIGVARINEIRDDKNITLDDDYIPTCLDVNASARLISFMSEIVGQFHSRAEQIAGRLADVARGGTAEVHDYLMLQLLNRLEPLAIHLSQLQAIHPLELYTEVVQMVGELSTFVSKTKRPPSFPPYLHDKLQPSFAPIMTTMRQCMSMVVDQKATSLPLVEKRFGIRVAQIPDRTLLKNAMFVLAVRADVPENTLRTNFPATTKLGTVERIRSLVNAQMVGIPLKPLPVAPRAIPFHAGFSYFELERNNMFWKELETSGGFAMHIGGDFPGLQLEFWAIRS